MKIRTEARRRAIMDAAQSLFEEQGFERATMSEIAARLGYSKTTLYSYFPSKEELFVACVEEEIAGFTGELLEILHAVPDLREALEAFGKAYLARVTAQRPVGTYRMLVGLPAETHLGMRYYEHGLRLGWTRACAFFEEQIAAGRLHGAAAWTMAMHLKGMLEAEHLDRRLLNAAGELDAKTISRTARDAVAAFLRAYGPAAQAEVLRRTA